MVEPPVAGAVAQPRPRRPLPQPPQDVDEAAERVVETVLAAADLAAMALGSRLGWYRVLADGGWRTAAELAAESDTSARYAQEWCEQQAAAGLIEVQRDDDGAIAGQDPLGRDRRYRMPAGLAAVLADDESPIGMAATVSQLAAALGGLDRLERAYRDGTGVAWAQHGEAMLLRQAESTRVGFSQLLAGWFTAVPELDASLREQRGLRILDVGCGLAWSSIALARAYPAATVDAVDIDPQTVQLARRNVAEAGLADRVVVHLGDAAQLGLVPGYHLVTAFECVHDLPDPVAVLASMRDLARLPAGAGQGAVVVADEAVGERFRAPAGRMDRMMYGFSLLVCLPDSMSTPGSAAIGTVMRPDTLRRLAVEAGFGSVQVLPVAHASWRFYRLHR